MQINKAGAVCIGLSLVAHALIFIIAKSAAPPVEPDMSMECTRVTQRAEHNSGTNNPSRGNVAGRGGGAGIGSPGTGQAMGPKSATVYAGVVRPCCGPGCSGAAAYENF